MEFITSVELKKSLKVDIIELLFFNEFSNIWFDVAKLVITGFETLTQDRGYPVAAAICL